MKPFDIWNEKKKQTDEKINRPEFYEREIYFARVGENIGHEQGGQGVDFLRPVLVLKKFNKQIFWAIPLSKTPRRGKYYFAFSFLQGIESVAILSQLKLVDAKRLERKIGMISQSDFHSLNKTVIDLLQEQSDGHFSSPQPKPEGSRPEGSLYCNDTNKTENIKQNFHITRNHPLAPLTWMKVGGSADYYVEVRTKDELQEAFGFAKKHGLPIIYLGQGSNMIVPDEGFRGLVIRLMNDAVEYDLEYSEDQALVRAEAGKILSRLIHEARKQGLNGLDNFVGIPGVMGAAVRGNIGIPTQELGELVKSVEIFDGVGFQTLTPEECQFVYRGSSIKEKYWLVWFVELLVSKGEPPLPAGQAGKKDELLLQRIAKQPKGHSCGSFFKNPDPKNALFAGKLIEECGLKGKKVGGAFISEKHGNFLMNDGTAKAAEIVQLAREVKQEVFAKKGVLLENEVLVYDKQGKLVSL